MHQIGYVAEVAGLSLRTIRHWEEVGLVMPSGRSAGGFRLYTDDEIERLRLVKQMKPLEFTLEEMREVLALRGRLAGSRGEAPTAARERLEVYVSVAEERCAALRRQLDAAREMAARLREETGRRAVGRAPR